MSTPALHLRPDLAQRLLEATAIENVEMLVRHGVRVIHAGDLLHIREARLEIRLPSGHDDHALTGVSTRPPEEVALMPADGRWQAVSRAEQVDGPGLPVVLAEDGGLGANFLRKVVEDLGNGAGHLLPAELVGEDLRQRTEPVRFYGRLAETQCFRI